MTYDNKLLKNKFDPYEFLIKKLNRMSWNGISDAEGFVEKSAAVIWFSQFRGYSEQIIKSVIVDGIFDNQFHNITYILNLVQSDDFQNIPSLTAYKLLYDFVCSMPKGIQELIDEDDLSMSQNVLALLAQCHNTP